MGTGRGSLIGFKGSHFKSDPLHGTTRRWRADFPHQPSRTLIEIEGGIYVNGRHNRGAGFAADLEKYLEAVLVGWRVVRLGPNELTADHIGRPIALVGDDREGGRA